MVGFTLKGQRPPEERPVAPGVVMRFDHIFEVDPSKMTIVLQHDMPAWDTFRIVRSRTDYLGWMHDHFAERVLSASELEAEP